MATSFDLPDVLKPLARLFDDPKPNVLMVVGTGVSISATRDSRASWKGLLLDGVSRIERLGIEMPDILGAERTLIEKAFSGEFDLNEILQRAESIIKQLGGVNNPRFAAWLKDSVYALRIKDDRRQTLDAIADLARTGALILTTNYDSLLSEATGLDPITWEEPNKILEVVNRKRKAIIHIHGHWSRPSSVVLGRTSYDRIKNAALAQTELRSLWLHWHWLYLGCGSGGLDDPNLGALLQWSHEAGLGESALYDYFLAAHATIDSLPDHIGKSTNLVKSAYTDHVNLPVLLQQLAPEARCSPFERVGPEGRRVRRLDESPLSSPFPSWQEYLDGAVPSLAADEEVIQRLNDFSWAFVLDAASIGKSTLAYRIAARSEYRNTPAYHLLLSPFTVDEIESDISPQAALARLARPGVLLIIDDAHQDPELAHTLWQQWRERPMNSRLIILATRIERPINLAGESSLHDLEIHTANPAVVLNPTPEDLARVANYVLARLGGSSRVQLNPPTDVLNIWYRSFGREIGAFVVAVSQRRHELARGDLTVPEFAGAAWMKERYLDKLGAPDIENAVCLAVFGEQDLELDLPEQCLPHPSRIDRLQKSGLAKRTSLGTGHSARYGLREPGWGQLILAAIEFSPNRSTIMIESAAKSISLAMSVSSFLRLHRPDEHALYWKQLAKNVHTVVADAPGSTLYDLGAFLNTAEEQCQKELVEGVWHALAAQPQRVVEQVIRAPLAFGGFLNIAIQQRHHTLVETLWRVLAAAGPDALAGRPLHIISGFLHTAAHHGQKLFLKNLWRALVAQPESIFSRASETPINWLGVFLNTAVQHGQHDLVRALWRALAAEPDRLAERAFESTLNDINAFLNAAVQHGQHDLVRALWRALAAQPDRLAEQAAKQTPSQLMSFLVLAPDDLKTEIIRRFSAEAWAYGPYRAQRFSTGAPGLARQFGLNGREDLKLALIDNILRRKNPADFSDLRNALTEMSRLLSFTTPDQENALVELLTVVCTEKWLVGVYRFGSTFGLAGALHMIAVHQPPTIICRFWHQAPTTRLRKEFSKPAALDDQGLHATIQFLGALLLAGWTINGNLLIYAPLDRIALLPKIVAHRQEAVIVEQWQRQLWLGLRVMASIGPGELIVDQEAIVQTLDLWRRNIDGAGDWHGTKEQPNTTAHRINVSMVNWLEDCARAGTGRLLPNQEPLWMLAGFPRDPKTLAS